MDANDRTNEEKSGPQPTPIREVVGASPPLHPPRAEEALPEGATQKRAAGMRGQRERPKEARDKGRPAPRPARQALEGQAAEPASEEDLPSCQFVSEGVEWIVRLSGRTSTGSVSDRGAPLLHLTFFRAEDPLVAVHEALLPGDSIDHLFEVDMNEVLAGAREVSVPEQPTEASSRSVTR